MQDLIEIVISIILVLGLVAYAILGQVSGVKDTGDKATIEQAKINQMISTSNVVTGATVRNYLNIGEPVSAKPTWDPTNPDSKLKVLIYNVSSTGTETVVSTGTKDNIKTRVKENSLYTVEKEYSPEGQLWIMIFKQNNMSEKVSFIGVPHLRGSFIFEGVIIVAG